MTVGGICADLHGDDAFLVNAIEPGAQRHLCFTELFFRALIKEVFLVMCLNVGVFQCLCDLVMRFLVRKTKLDLYLQRAARVLQKPNHVVRMLEVIAAGI